ncbi:hypothetical protein B0H12DRAFT_140933 [Mycena haematopus]|nr:hypothetical protein B0H12DRAFT_140933 [Mycena haematopus]
MPWREERTRTELSHAVTHFRQYNSLRGGRASCDVLARPEIIHVSFAKDSGPHRSVACTFYRKVPSLRKHNSSRRHPRPDFRCLGRPRLCPVISTNLAHPAHRRRPSRSAGPRALPAHLDVVTPSVLRALRLAFRLRVGQGRCQVEQLSTTGSLLRPTMDFAVTCNMHFATEQYLLHDFLSTRLHQLTLLPILLLHGSQSAVHNTH